MENDVRGEIERADHVEHSKVEHDEPENSGTSPFVEELMSFMAGGWQDEMASTETRSRVVPNGEDDEDEEVVDEEEVHANE